MGGGAPRRRKHTPGSVGLSSSSDSELFATVALIVFPGWTLRTEVSGLAPRRPDCERPSGRGEDVSYFFFI